MLHCRWLVACVSEAQATRRCVHSLGSSCAKQIRVVACASRTSQEQINVAHAGYLGSSSNGKQWHRVPHIPRANRTLTALHGVRQLCTNPIYISVTSTPNPNALKFTPPCDVTGTVDTITLKKTTYNKESVDQEGLLKTIIDLEGVDGVMFGFDFITVRKEESVDWDMLEGRILEAITPHAKQAAAEGRAILKGYAAPTSPLLDRQDPVVLQIIGLLEEKVRPNVQADGGDVQLRAFDHEKGVVWVSMIGACASCPSSTVTVKFMIKNLLTHFIDEVKDVRSVDEDEQLELCAGYVKGVRVV